MLLTIEYVSDCAISAYIIIFSFFVHCVCEFWNFTGITKRFAGCVPISVMFCYRVGPSVYPNIYQISSYKARSGLLDDNFSSYAPCDPGRLCDDDLDMTSGRQSSW